MDPRYGISRFANLVRQRGLPVYANQALHDRPNALHDHDFLEVAVIVSGDSIHCGIHGENPISTGDCLILHPGQWHGYTGQGAVSLYNLCLPLTVFAHELAWLAADPQVAALLPRRDSPVPPQQVLQVHLGADDLAPVAAALERIRSMLEAPDAILARTELIAQAAVALARIAAAAPRRHLAADDDAAVAALASAMEGELARPWKLADLAARAGMTREHLCRRFRRVHGLPPLAWLNRRRAEQAAVLLLSTDAAVAEIGRRVGWADPNYCARRFRAVFGVNPATYRLRAPDVIRGP